MKSAEKVSFSYTFWFYYHKFQIVNSKLYKVPHSLYEIRWFNPNPSGFSWQNYDYPWNCLNCGDLQKWFVELSSHVCVHHESNPLYIQVLYLMCSLSSIFILRISYGMHSMKELVQRCYNAVLFLALAMVYHLLVTLLLMIHVTIACSMWWLILWLMLREISLLLLMKIGHCIWQQVKLL